MLSRDGHFAIYSPTLMWLVDPETRPIRWSNEVVQARWYTYERAVEVLRASHGERMFGRFFIIRVL